VPAVPSSLSVRVYHTSRTHYPTQLTVIPVRAEPPEVHDLDSEEDSRHPYAGGSTVNSNVVIMEGVPSSLRVGATEAADKSVIQIEPSSLCA